MFYALWAMAPIFVSVVSFAVYVINGNELSVAKAFTVRIPRRGFRVEGDADARRNAGHRAIPDDTRTAQRAAVVDRADPAGTPHLISFAFL
jgi:hypothetical protein